MDLLDLWRFARPVLWQKPTAGKFSTGNGFGAGHYMADDGDGYAPRGRQLSGNGWGDGRRGNGDGDGGLV